MRKSVLVGDPGYDPEVFGSKVFLGGLEVPQAVTADEEKGAVLVNKLDGKGMAYLDLETGEVAREWLFGEVKIVLSED
jgi:hypothetical protein